MAKRSETKAPETSTSTTDINAVQLIGKVIRPNQSEKCCRFTLDCAQVTPKGNLAHSFIPCIWFNEGSEETVAEGERIGLQGYIKSGKYEKDGHTVYTLDVVAENITFTS